MQDRKTTQNEWKQQIYMIAGTPPIAITNQEVIDICIKFGIRKIISSKSKTS